jgi:soluble lytic murein transglycosylase-like protein
MVIARMIALVGLLVVAAAAAQGPAPTRPPAKSLRIVIEESIRKQKESILRQVDSARPVEPDWFTVPWTRDENDAFIARPSPEPAAPDSPAASPASQVWCAPIKPGSLEGAIGRAATRNGYSSGLLRAVIEKESAFHPCAVSPKGAMGLMQLMPATAAALGVRDPFDPLQSIDGGARYLGDLLKRFNGDWRLALGAYNAGPGAVEQHSGVPPYRETRAFVQSVARQAGPRPTRDQNE